MSFTFVAKVGFDDSAHITLPAISKTGHTCRWAQGKSNGTTHSGGSTAIINKDTTFYAKCERITLTEKPFNFQFDPGSSWVCLYGKAGEYQTDTSYACMSEQDYQQMGGAAHGGSIVSWTAYCYHCCSATKQGISFTKWDLTISDSCVYQY